MFKSTILKLILLNFFVLAKLRTPVFLLLSIISIILGLKGFTLPLHLTSSQHLLRHVTAEAWLIIIVEKCELSWTPSTNRKLTMQLKICLGNRADKECWHIIKLRLIAWIIALYLIILKCPLECVCVMCAQPTVFLCHLCRTMGLAWGSFTPRKRVDSLSIGELGLNSQSNSQIHN